MDIKSTSARTLSHNEGEFIYEQWAKYLTINIVDDDVLNDFGPTSRIVKEITAEKLRCVFSEGYRLAMLQMLQQTKDLQAAITLNEATSAGEVLNNQNNFINEKIEDSFLLNRTDSDENFSLSRKQFQNLGVMHHHNFLKW